MCGIAGMFFVGPEAGCVSLQSLEEFSRSLANRGPDAVGMWISPDRTFGCVHRRLSIIDIDPRSDQPMHSADGRYTLVYNGEIYNYRELRLQLEQDGHQFFTSSDSEVLLHMFMRHGLAMLSSLRGMYAFAIYDQLSETLTLVRDPLGIKPLYYTTGNSSFCFASQVKALLRAPCVDLREQAAGHVGFFVWGSVPEPYTLYRGIRCLPSGTYLVVQRHRHSEPVRFSQPVNEFLDRNETDSPRSQAESHARLHKALEESVRAHLTSDVPVAVFLSAGIDSCAIAALAAEIRDGLEALTLGFEPMRGSPRDETALAAQVAGGYGIRHHVKYIDQSMFHSHRESLLRHMDQPSIDGVNTYFISWLARQAGFKVALSGLGGDELFGGYPSFRQVPAMVKTFGFTRSLPGLGKALRIVSSRVIGRRASPKYAAVFEYGGTFGGAYLVRRGLFMPWELTKFLDTDLVNEGWRDLASVESMNALIRPLDGLRPNTRADFLRVSALEMSYYMRTQLLRDADWAGMAHSVEIRVPMVDMFLLRQIGPLRTSIFAPKKPSFVEALRTPPPLEILNRPKTGFEVPVREWMQEGQDAPIERGLRGWAKHLYREFGYQAK